MVENGESNEPPYMSFLNNDGVTAVAAESPTPSALEISVKLLCDSGAAQDLISSGIANRYTHSRCPIKLIHFQTANGPHLADTALTMLTPGLGDGESNAYAMNTTPSALSIGQRVLNRVIAFL